VNAEDYDNLVNLSELLLKMNSLTRSLIDEINEGCAHLEMYPKAVELHNNLQEALDVLAILREEDIS